LDLLKTLKLLLQINQYDYSKDDLLNAILLVSKQQVFTECNKSEENLDDKLNALIIDICIHRYNRLGNEGKVSDSVGPLSTTFLSVEDLPNSITKRFGSCRRMKVFR